jgi:hypothetical protein
MRPLARRAGGLIRFLGCVEKSESRAEFCCWRVGGPGDTDRKTGWIRGMGEGFPRDGMGGRDGLDALLSLFIKAGER